MHRATRRQFEMGIRAGAARCCFSRPAFGPEHGQGDGLPLAEMACGIRTPNCRRQHAEAPVARAALAGIAAFTPCSGRNASISVRAKFQGIKILVHPNARWKLSIRATFKEHEQDIRTVEAAPPGTKWAIGTNYTW